jgi:DDE superfamily endonuclease
MCSRPTAVASEPDQDIVSQGDLEEESDDDQDSSDQDGPSLAKVGMLIIPYLLQNFAKQSCHTSSLSGEQYVCELLRSNERRILECVRMRLPTFRQLCEQYRQAQPPSAWSRVSVEERLAIFMFIVGNSAGNRLAQERFQHSGETISRVFYSVLRFLVSLARTYIRLPDADVLPSAIAHDPKFYPYFKDCLGAIDGSHIPAWVAAHRQDAYRNRKGGVSQNVMAACSFDLTFLYVLAGWEGSAHDGRVLRDALGKGFHIPDGKYYLADAGYTATSKFLTPYRCDEPEKVVFYFLVVKHS